MSLAAIILAAGKSTRMKSKLPKALQPVCGQPMLTYVLRAAYEAGCERVIVVVGWGKEQVMAEFASDNRISWIEQTEQLGTGHAVRVCENEIARQAGDVFVLAGDGPLIRGEVLQTLLHSHQQEKAAGSLATAVLDEPSGYGRIQRDAHDQFVEIVEHLDCSPTQLQIREVFPSYYCVRSDELLTALKQLKNDNKKKEYYLTDIYRHMRQAGKKVAAVRAVASEDVIGVNNRQQLQEVDTIMQKRIQRTLMESGVTIVSAANTYVEDSVTIGADTIVHPSTFIGQGSTIGSDCVIGPFAFLPAGSIVADGVRVTGDPSSVEALRQ